MSTNDELNELITQKQCCDVLIDATGTHLKLLKKLNKISTRKILDIYDKIQIYDTFQCFKNQIDKLTIQYNSEVMKMGDNYFIRLREIYLFNIEKIKKLYEKDNQIKGLKLQIECQNEIIKISEYHIKLMKEYNQINEEKIVKLSK